MKYQRNTPTYNTHLFKYQPEKIEVGTCYHYQKSNLDGSNPAIVSVYMAAKSHIEVLKVENNSEVLAYVTADMNWDIFCPDHMLSWHILPDGNLRNQAISSLSMKDHSFTMWVGDAEFHSKITHYPVHNYTFDFTSLNIAFKHLINPYESFEIGIVEPNWNIVQQPGFNPQGKTSEVLVFRGKVRIEYLGDDLYHYHICHKYQISGEGLGNQTGTIWVSKEKGHFVNFEHPRSDNPAWEQPEDGTAID